MFSLCLPFRPRAYWARCLPALLASPVPVSACDSKRLKINQIQRRTHLLRSNDYLNVRNFVPAPTQLVAPALDRLECSPPESTCARLGGSKENNPRATPFSCVSFNQKLFTRISGSPTSLHGDERAESAKQEHGRIEHPCAARPLTHQDQIII